MEKTAQLLLDLFADTAAIKRVLHSENWQRLYDFTIHVYLRHLPISSWNVVTHLLTHDFSHEAASRISAEFERFIALLTRYDAQKTGPVKSL